MPHHVVDEEAIWTAPSRVDVGAWMNRCWSSPSRLTVGTLLSGEFDGLQSGEIGLLCLSNLSGLLSLDIGGFLSQLLHQGGSRQSLSTEPAELLVIFLLLRAICAEDHVNQVAVTSAPYEGGSVHTHDSSDKRTNIPHTSTPAAAARSLTSTNSGCSMMSPISCPPATSNEMT